MSSRIAPQEIADRAMRLLEGDLAIPSTDDVPLASWEPSAPVAAAQAQLRGLERRPINERLERLRTVAGQLLGAARIAWWPIMLQGELDISADEKPLAVINETGIDVRQPKIRDLRQAVKRLLAAAQHLELANPDTVSLGRVERVALPAIGLAIDAALLAVTASVDDND